MRFFFLFLLVIVAACSSGLNRDATLDDCDIIARVEILHENDTLTVCDFSLCTDTIDMPFSELVKNYCLQKMDRTTEGAVISSTAIPVVSKKYIVYANNHGEEVKVFDRSTGNYLTDIGQLGQGPEDFVGNVSSMNIVEDEEIYICDANGMKLQIYQLKNGEYAGQIPLSYRATFPKIFIDKQDTTLLVSNTPFYVKEPIVWKQDFHGKVLQQTSSMPFKRKQWEGIWGLGLENVTMYNAPFKNEYVLSTSYLPNTEAPDTLFHYNIASNRLIPRFTIKWNEDKIPYHCFFEFADYYLCVIFNREAATQGYMLGPSQTIIVNKHNLRGAYVNLLLDKYNNIPMKRQRLYISGRHITSLFEATTIYAVTNMKPEEVDEEDGIYLLYGEIY